MEILIKKEKIMSGKQYIGILIMTGVASLLGGTLLSKFMWPDAVTAQTGQRGIITTNGIQLVNEEGKVRASLRLWDGEHPALILSDDVCDRRASFSVYPKMRAGLAFYGDDCKRRAALELEADRLPELVLRDQFDVPRYRVHFLKDGSPRMVLYGPNGKDIWKVPPQGE
jgi:hypothetical protein